MVAITEIKKKAKEMGISSGKLKKDELILAIQKAEGNFPCFKTSAGECEQNACLWREDCLSHN